MPTARPTIPILAFSLVHLISELWKFFSVFDKRVLGLIKSYVLRDCIFPRSSQEDTLRFFVAVAHHKARWNTFAEFTDSVHFEYVQKGCALKNLKRREVLCLYIWLFVRSQFLSSPWSVQKISDTASSVYRYCS